MKKGNIKREISKKEVTQKGYAKMKKGVSAKGEYGKGRKSAPMSRWV